jgi:hypothetical protein
MSELPRTADLIDALADALAANAHAVERIANAVMPLLAGPTRATSGPLTPTTAAPIAGLHPRTIRRALQAGLLRGEKHAGRWQIEPEDFAAWRAIGSPTASVRAMPRIRARAGGSRATMGADAIAGKSMMVGR